jgi:DNA repair protein RadC
MRYSKEFKAIYEHIELNGNELASFTTESLFTLVLGGVPARTRQQIIQCLDELKTKDEDIRLLPSADILAALGGASQFDKMTAIRLQALIEVARRLMRPKPQQYSIRSAEDAARLLRLDLMYLDHEEMHVILLDTKSQVVQVKKVYQGTVDASVLRIAEILRPAVVRNCPHIVVCHNHPSGDCNPSSEDIEVTRQLAEAGRLLEIELLDHIIIGNPRYVSLKEIMRW